MYAGAGLQRAAACRPCLLELPISRVLPRVSHFHLRPGLQEIKRSQVVWQLRHTLLLLGHGVPVLPILADIIDAARAEAGDPEASCSRQIAMKLVCSVFVT